MLVRWLFYVVVYGFLGYLLERIIDLVYYGRLFDASYLFLPVQPMYGVGVTICIFFHMCYKKSTLSKGLSIFLLLITAYTAVALTEITAHTLHRLLTGKNLWDYRHAFPFCPSAATCIVPTGAFALLALFTVRFIHPHVLFLTTYVADWMKIALIALVLADIFFSYSGVVLL